MNWISRYFLRRKLRRAFQKTLEEHGDAFCKSIYDIEMAQSKWWDLLPWDEERRTDK